MNIWGSLLKGIHSLINYIVLKKNNVFFSRIPKIKGTVFVRNKGCFVIGDAVKINSGPNYNVIGGDSRSNFIVYPHGELKIGDNVGISNSTIICSNKVDIEDYVYLGGGVKIYDTDFHSLNFFERISRPDPGISTAPIRIGSGAFIGANSIVLKGVSVGERSVVGAGSVVTKSIPADEVWAGNPARFIRRLEQWHEDTVDYKSTDT